MDIRTKFVFAYVAVALGCMLALGVATYVQVDVLLTDQTLEQLDGLAEGKETALELVVSGWEERVVTLTRQTALLEGLRARSRRGPDSPGGLARVLDLMVASAPAVAGLAIYDSTGARIARSGASDPTDTGPVPERLPWTDSGVRYHGIDASDPTQPRVAFVAPLSLDEASVGMLHVRLTAEGVVDIAGTYSGLGETGETLVLAPLDDERAVILHPVRFPDESPAVVEWSREGGDPVSIALSGGPHALWKDATDYRSVPVWAATRHLEETGWGVVVKVDDHEERAPVVAFRDRLIRLGLSISAFAILLGTLVGLRIAKPIHDLAGVANQIRDGTMSARAVVASQDEVGQLARTFNDMADELEQRLMSLQEYRRFFDVSLDLLCIAGTDGYFKEVNPSFTRVLGWSADELTRQPFVDIVHPDDVEPTIHEIEKLSQGIPTVSFENRFQCADGTYARLRWTAFPEAETGRLYAIAHALTDGELT